jgi:hypothetical protein
VRLLSTLNLEDKERVREVGAFVITALALLLSVASVGDANSADEGVHANVLAADAYAWYQAKNIRQTSYQLALDEFQMLAGQGAEGGSVSGPPGDTPAYIGDRMRYYEAQIARYESEPDPADPSNPLKGEGKVQLLAQAEHHQEERSQALVRNASFDYATVASGVGIVLAAAGVLIGSARFLGASAVMGAFAALFILNAVVGIVALDFYIT